MRILKSLFVLVAASAFSLVSAQQIFDLQISEVTLDKAAYESGETITGEFDLYNFGANVSNLTYSIAISAEFENYESDHLYSTELFDLGSLNSEEYKVIPFELLIPEGIVGENLGLEIQVISSSGGLVAFDSATINISGTPAPKISISQAKININETDVIPQAGPTISEEVPGTHIFTATNENTTILEFYKKVSIFSEKILGNPVFEIEETENVLSIAPGGSLDISTQLPLEGLEPGIYVGKVELINPNQSIIVPDLSFRYIIGGEIATIQAVEAVREENGSIKFTINYTGIPNDITGETNQILEDADVSIKIQDNAGIVVFEEVMNLVDLAQIGEIEFITEPIKANQFVADFEISKSGESLDKYFVEYSDDFDIDSIKDGTASSFNLNLLYIALGILIILIIIFVLVRRKKISYPMAAILLFVCMGIFATGISVDSYTRVGSYSISPPGDGGNYAPTVVITSPKKFNPNNPEATSYEPGESFYLVTNVSALSCSNGAQCVSVWTPEYNKDWRRDGWWTAPELSRAQDARLTQGNPNYYKPVASNAGWQEEHEGCPGYTTAAQRSYPGLKSGPYIAPDAPGEYKFWVAVENWAASHKDKEARRGVTLLYQTIKVVGDPESCEAGAACTTPNICGDDTSGVTECVDGQPVCIIEQPDSCPPGGDGDGDSDGDGTPPVTTSSCEIDLPDQYNSVCVRLTNEFGENLHQTTFPKAFIGGTAEVEEFFNETFANLLPDPPVPPATAPVLSGLIKNVGGACEVEICQTDSCVNTFSDQAVTGICTNTTSPVAKIDAVTVDGECNIFVSGSNVSECTVTGPGGAIEYDATTGWVETATNPEFNYSITCDGVISDEVSCVTGSVFGEI